MSPRQVYRCPVHGEFEVVTQYKNNIPDKVACPKMHKRRRCFQPSKWIPSAPNFIGGPTTGAQKE